jgi:hypothetical protein
LKLLLMVTERSQPPQAWLIDLRQLPLPLEELLRV